jgi:recombination protein RecT
MGYYAMFEYMNGFRKALYWSKEKMINHADRYSPAFSKDAKGGKYPKVSFADYEAGKYPKSDEWLYSSHWYQCFDDMGCKTMLRQLLSKWGVLSIEMQTALEADNAVINEDLTPSYVETEEEFYVPNAEKEPDQIEAKTEEKATTEPQDAAAALFS